MGFLDTPCSGLPNVKWDWYCDIMATLVQNMNDSVVMVPQQVVMMEE